MRTAIVALAAVLAAGLLGGCTDTVSPAGRAHLLAAQSAYQGGDDLAVVQETSKFLELHPKVEEAGEAHYLRGMSELRQKNAASARADFVNALELGKRQDLLADANLALGNLSYDGGDLREAEVRYRAVLANVPAGAPPADQAMYRLGSIYQRLGKWREADQQFSRLIHLFDGNRLAKYAEDRVNATRWSVQAGAFATPAAAGDLAEKLKAAGLPARVDLDRREGKLMHLVRVGSYSTFDPAQADLPKVKSVVSDALVVPAK